MCFILAKNKLHTKSSLREMFRCAFEFHKNNLYFIIIFFWLFFIILYFKYLSKNQIIALFCCCSVTFFCSVYARGTCSFTSSVQQSLVWGDCILCFCTCCWHIKPEFFENYATKDSRWTQPRYRICQTVESIGVHT